MTALDFQSCVVTCDVNNFRKVGTSHFMVNQHNIPNKNDYIRFALDGLRRTSLPEDEAKFSDITSIGMLANFAHAIAMLYDRQEKEKVESQIVSAHDLKILIQQLAKWFDTGEPPGQAELRKTDVPLDSAHRHHSYIPASEVPQAFERFTEELCFGLKELTDPKKTAALIAYEMFHHGRFFERHNRLIAHALSAYVLMRYNEKLPVFRGNKRQLFNDMKTASRSRANLENFYIKQFVGIPPIEAPRDPAPPSDAWSVQSIHIIDHRATIFDTRYVLRGGKAGADRIAELHFITGKYPDELAVFRPIRMALHETVAALVTRVKMSNPSNELYKFIGTNPIYSQNICIQANKLDGMFDEMADKFERYAKFLIEDHFNILSPQPRVRAIIDHEKKIIEKRIEDNFYDPRAAEARDALRTLVADRLLREYYQAEIRKIVDKEIDNYLNINDNMSLQLKANPNRIAWVTAGGPAAGKSSLATLIDAERKKYGETSPICRVNPDDYRELLLERTDDAYNFIHGSLTHGETRKITEIVIDRLWQMVTDRNGVGYAPDMWLDMVSSTDKRRLELAKYKGAQVRLYVASCPPEVAVERAYRRARVPNGTDEGRYVPTAIVLQGHRSVSQGLPEVMSEISCVLRLFDTEPDHTVYNDLERGSPLLTASATGFDKNLEIHEPPSFIAFVKKAALDHHATRPEALYSSNERNRSIIIKQLMSYINGGIILNFRYPSAPTSYKIGEKIMIYFAHIGLTRAYIDDLGGFIQHLEDESLALDFLRNIVSLEGMQELRIQGSEGSKMFAHNGTFHYVKHPDPNSVEGKILIKLETLLRKRFHETTERTKPNNS